MCRSQVSIRWLVLISVIAFFAACSGPGGQAPAEPGTENMAARLTTARAADGAYISWREHLIDDEGTSGVALRPEPLPSFRRARATDSPEMPLRVAD